MSATAHDDSAPPTAPLVTPRPTAHAVDAARRSRHSVLGALAVWRDRRGERQDGRCPADGRSRQEPL